MSVPYVFGNATTAIPLSNLDANFNTGLTIGNTTVGLGNTVTSLGNVTLANVTILSGTSNVNSSAIVNGTSNVVVTSSGGNITMTTNGSEVMRVTTSGTVGIGTTSPSAKLQVFGGRSYFVANSEPYALGVGYSGSVGYYIGSDSANTSLVFSSAGGGEIARFSSAGYLGVGTNAPHGVIQPYYASDTSFTGTGLAALEIGSAATTGYFGSIGFNVGGSYNYPIAKIAMQYNGATGSFLQFGTTSSFAAGVNNTAMVINPSGSVGIGTASPAAILDVTNGASPASRLRVGVGAGAAGTLYSTLAAGDYVSFETNAAERMRIDSSGNLLVGTTTQLASSKFSVLQSASEMCMTANNTASTNPKGYYINYTVASPNNGTTNSLAYQFNDSTAARFYVYSNGGIANFSGNNTNLSDETLKKDIQLAPNYLDKLCQVSVKTFLYKDQTDTDLNTGVIAQELQAVCPELVGTMDIGINGKSDVKLAIYETDLKYAMLKAIQELKAEVDSLKQQLGK